jgi:hypothetical protein
VSVLPVRPDAEQADGLHLLELDLVVRELARAGQLAGQPGFAGTLRAGAVPAQQLEVIGRLVPVRPLDRQEPPGSIREDVERPLAIRGVGTIRAQRRNR